MKQEKIERGNLLKKQREALKKMSEEKFEWLKKFAEEHVM